jgi:TonB-linked SusC/RagA family outer membrane protein
MRNFYLKLQVCISIIMLFHTFSSASEPWQNQQQRITGKVVDESGKAMPGVSVKLKNSPIGISTNANGQYSISVPNQNAMLVFSYMGFVTQEIAVGKNVINVTLKAKDMGLDEVVVIGYGTQARKDLTGAVGQVNMADLQKAPVKSFDEALAGRVAGVQVSGNDGQPGSTNNVVIRGGNSVTQDNSPLYVIDGFPLENPDYNVINPSDIESMDILKDASATAIYGARGANGVIIITTKKGKEGLPVISYNGYYGTQHIRKTMDLLSPYEFVKYQSELNPTEAEKTYFTGGKTLESYRDAQGINFQDHVFRTGPMHNHDISLRGGSKTTKYAISGNVFRQEGIFINSDFARNQGRFSLDQTVNSKLKVGLNANLSNSKSSGSLIGSANDQGATVSALFSVWAYRPVAGNGENLLEMFDDPAFDAGMYADYRVNPILNAQNELKRRINNSLILNGYADYTIIPNLILRIRGGLTTGLIRDESFNNSLTSSGYRLGANGALYNTFTTNLLNENTLTYKKIFQKKHNLEVLAGFTNQTNIYKTNGFSAMDLVKESLGLDGLDNSRSIIPVSVTSKWGLMSYLGRINYNFNSKYLLTASIRADGSSKFVGPNKWGYFPSGSLAWRMSAEDFMKPLSFVSDAKLRISYGATGNNRVSDFPYLSIVQTNNAYYSFGNQIPAPGLSLTQFGNPDLKWETTYQSNIGYDLSLYKGRISVTADVYRKKTTDLLLDADIPFTTGLATVLKNVGSMQNEGLELTLSTVNIKNDKFSWSSSFNISFNRNKILALADNQQTLSKSVPLRTGYNNLFPYIAVVGKPVAQFYGLVWDGVYQLGDFDKLPDGRYQLKNNITTNGKTRVPGVPGVQPGDIKYKDINGDLVVDASDYTVIGQALPSHTGGFSNNFNYKNFDLNVFFQWSYGNDILNANRLFLEGNESGSPFVNQYATYADRWTETNPSNTYYATNGRGPFAYSSRLLEDGSFLRLKTVSLGYNFSEKVLKSIKLKALRIYASGQNLITWTKYSGMDPEVSVRNSALTPGFDFSAYPRARVFTFGINASL